MLLTKSDFKVARTCATKLYYRKRKYPTTLEDDEYLQFLADGGFMVETLAHLHFPHGTELPFEGGVEDAARHSVAIATRPLRAGLADEPCGISPSLDQGTECRKNTGPVWKGDGVGGKTRRRSHSRSRKGPRRPPGNRRAALARFRQLCSNFVNQPARRPHAGPEGSGK